MKTCLPRAAAMACLMLVLESCATSHSVSKDEAPRGGPIKVVNLSQGWNKAEREWFWFTTQGSQILPYEWFLNLEQASNTHLFRSTANFERFRYLTADPSPLNPDGLPVGFVKDVDKHGQSWIGLTCAACHTGQVNFNGVGLRIDGAPTLADFTTFFDELAAALAATSKDAAKFERFARAILRDAYDLDSANELRQALFETTAQLEARRHLNASPVAYGYARLDAFGDILNMVLAHDLGIPENRTNADAPVSYPFLWDTPQHDVVQWNGSASNTPPGPLLRNTGELLGVFASVTLSPSGLMPGYENSIDFENIGKLEKSLEKLWSPQWPTEVLPAIDPLKAARGKAHYEKYCVRCHAFIDRTSPARRVSAVLTPLAEVGTDPKMATNFSTRVAKTGPLEGAREYVLVGEPFGPTAGGWDILLHAVVGSILSQPIESTTAAIGEFLKVPRSHGKDLNVYKTRPLNGIWATAPYLHNGSVPNLWQVLVPPEQRVKQFYVGSRDFDPKNVGFDTQPWDGGFRFDTTLPGNSNAGHAYGTRELSEDQKWELIEFLKSL
ncbi:MAG: di-heme-cytochrome C peroxidase [Hyalangium sp.]|uniref:di-heme-cytochrome C peroxidase n=1 Tax=Hyalangium sp. TaxID=2028555 RepID=UPI00389991C1